MKLGKFKELSDGLYVQAIVNDVRALNTDDPFRTADFKNTAKKLALVAYVLRPKIVTDCRRINENGQEARHHMSDQKIKLENVRNICYDHFSGRNIRGIDIDDSSGILY